MIIKTIQMPRREAWIAMREYRAALRKRYSETDEALMRGYKALASGRRVLDLVAVMQQAGMDSQGRPTLAICRADAEEVLCNTWTGGRGEFWSGDQRRNAARGRIIRLPHNTFPGHHNYQLRARVPSIPPRFRPDADLKHYHLLWEAEWASVPKDPLLLKHLGRYFYAVLAQWDLTELERAILR